MRRRGNTRSGPGLIGSMARTAVIAGTATATVKAVGGAMDSGKQQAAAQQQAAQQQAAQQAAALQAQQEQLAMQQAAAQEQAATPSGELSFDEQLVQIQKLAVLKDQGILTEEEFQAKKKMILGL